MKPSIEMQQNHQQKIGSTVVFFNTPQTLGATNIVGIPSSWMHPGICPCSMRFLRISSTSLWDWFICRGSWFQPIQFFHPKSTRQLRSSSQEGHMTWNNQPAAQHHCSMVFSTTLYSRYGALPENWGEKKQNPLRSLVITTVWRK